MDKNKDITVIEITDALHIVDYISFTALFEKDTLYVYKNNYVYVPVKFGKQHSIEDIYITSIYLWLIHGYSEFNRWSQTVFDAIFNETNTSNNELSHIKNHPDLKFGYLNDSNIPDVVRSAYNEYVNTLQALIMTTQSAQEEQTISIKHEQSAENSNSNTNADIDMSLVDETIWGK